MSDSPVLARHLIRDAEERCAGDAGLDPEHCHDLGAFGWLRGIRDRAVMLELRRKDGNILAVAYAFLDRVEFEPSSGITLHAGDTQVHISGRHLNGAPGSTFSLFEGLTRHRVPWIAEAGERGRLTIDSSACVVERIVW